MCVLYAPMNKTPADRLKELRVKRNFETAKAAADAYGWNEVTYRAHENGGRNIPIHTARKYALAYGSSAQYILGIGSQSADQKDGTAPQLVSVRVVGKASAGAFRFEEALDSYRGFDVPAVPRPDIPAGVQYAVEVDGPSVNLKIPDGAYAICAPLDKFPGGPKHGQLVHVVRERAGLYEHTIKELQYTPEGRRLVPCSSDPRFQEPLAIGELNGDDVVRIQGVVIGAYTPF